MSYVVKSLPSDHGAGAPESPSIPDPFSLWDRFNKR